MKALALGLGLLIVAPLAAWQNQQLPPANKAAAAPAATPGTGVTLTGAAAARNENVAVNRIDSETLKEANIRVGTSITLIPQPPVETGFFATEHGLPPGELPVLRPPAAFSGFHGELFEWLQNSVFNARTFFQVGSVKPSRQNYYGGRFAGRVRGLGTFTGGFSQRKIRGMVNGNVLVPLAGERTPTASDPAVRAEVSRYLAAYPDQLPNRPDFDLRALNTNAPQRIDETAGSLRLDRSTGQKGSLSLFDELTRQRIDAFQLVAGQNPDTDIHSHRVRATWRYALSETMEMAAGLGFTRNKSVLVAEPNAVGPRVRFGYQIEELGPDSHFPINRATNAYRGGTIFTRRHGSHILTWGGDLTRFQLNGIETNNARGLIWFSNNFGRTAIENLRAGTPTTYEVNIGDMYRGFRNWQGNGFAADQWKIGPRLQLYYGLRYGFDTTPVEVNGLNTIPYPCDCNNFSPRFSLAWRAWNNWVVRAGYTVSFAQVPAVTYSQVRYNPPLAPYIIVQNPDFLDPLRGINLDDPNIRVAPTVLANDLVAPYTHQYTLTVERRLADRYVLRVGYLGSRTFKLLDSYQQNRAVPVPGIPLTTGNVDQRRPDPRYYDVKYIVNAGAAWMDAAQATIEAPYRRGLLWGITYTFSKALDTGSDYAGTAANRDIAKGRAQTQADELADKKGLSNFDSTHAAIVYYAYEFPRPFHIGSFWGGLVNGWQVSGSTLMKTGTPLTLYVGSDAPGFGNVDGGPGDRPNILEVSILGQTIGNPDTAPLILQRNRFAYIVAGQDRGNLGRNTFRKEGIANFNAAISKQWHLDGKGEHVLSFRCEAFNLTNHPQFDEPQRNLSSPAFGKITNTLNDGRILQLGLRLTM